MQAEPEAMMLMTPKNNNSHYTGMSSIAPVESTSPQTEIKHRTA